MTCFGCPPDKALALIREGRIERLSFSRSFLEFLGRQLGGSWQVLRFTFKLEEELNDASIFAIVDRRKGKVLRLSLSRETAEFLCRDPSRYVAAASIAKWGRVQASGGSMAA